MPYAVAAYWKARPESIETIRALLIELREASRAEPACLQWEVHTSLDDPASFFLYEVYDDASGFDAHRVSEHFQRLVVDRALALLDERTVEMYERLAE